MEVSRIAVVAATLAVNLVVAAAWLLAVWMITAGARNGAGDEVDGAITFYEHAAMALAVVCSVVAVAGGVSVWRARRRVTVEATGGAVLMVGVFLGAPSIDLALMPLRLDQHTEGVVFIGFIAIASAIFARSQPRGRIYAMALWLLPVLLAVATVRYPDLRTVIDDASLGGTSCAEEPARPACDVPHVRAALAQTECDARVPSPRAGTASPLPAPGYWLVVAPCERLFVAPPSEIEDSIQVPAPLAWLAVLASAWAALAFVVAARFRDARDVTALRVAAIGGWFCAVAPAMVYGALSLFAFMRAVR